MWAPKTIYFASAAVSFAIVLLSTVMLVMNCYIPINLKTNAECALKNHQIFEDKFVLIAMVAAAAAFILNVYNVLDFCNACNACKEYFEATNYQYIVMSLVFAIVAAVYDHTIVSKLKTIPTSEVNEPGACMVCPKGHDSFFLFLLHFGVFIAFVNVIVVYFVVRKSPQGSATVTERPMKVRLNPLRNDDDEEL